MSVRAGSYSHTLARATPSVRAPASVTAANAPRTSAHPPARCRASSTSAAFCRRRRSSVARAACSAAARSAAASDRPTTARRSLS